MRWFTIVSISGLCSHTRNSQNDDVFAPGWNKKETFTNYADAIKLLSGTCTVLRHLNRGASIDAI